MFFGRGRCQMQEKRLASNAVMFGGDSCVYIHTEKHNWVNLAVSRIVCNYKPVFTVQLFVLKNNFYCTIINLISIAILCNE